MTKQQIKNNALLMFDDRYIQRWVDAFGIDVVKFFLDAGTPDQSAGINFTTTETGSSTTTNSLTAGKILTITTGTNDFDGVNMQLLGEQFKLETGKPLYFGIKCDIDHATNTDFLVGLCETDTDLLADATTHGIDISGDGVFFSKIDATTTIAAKTYLDGVETGTANYATAMTTSSTVYEIYWDGSTVYFYVDNNLVTSINSGLPDGDLTPSICFREGASGTKAMNISWFKCIQLR